MATRRDRQEEAGRDRQQFLRAIGEAETFQGAWRLVTQGKGRE